GALQQAKAVLDRQGCVGILPEGTRGQGDMSSMNAGVAWLALNSGAVVVPVAVLGTRLPGEHKDTIPRPRRRLHVVFGEPLSITRDAGVSGRVSMDRATEKIRLSLAQHIRGAIDATGQRLPSAEMPHTATPTKHEGQ
ncbi:MAG: 1-acyl-sn-glycerol-3-phosphate acyltransferase, partial [Acidobacteria bacterium]|nr:1-acyl-sn-glycerol-3-phosphate acyltransferase [Acidobacteriota bacterium]